MAVPSPPPPAPASHVLFNVASARVLRHECRRLFPGLRLIVRRDWSAAPNQTNGGRLDALRAAAWSRLAGRDMPVKCWHWREDEQAFRAQANHLLRHFVSPLVSAGHPYCLGLPFPAEVLAPVPLTLSERGRLDLEDIGLLLGGEAHPAATQPAAGCAHEGLDPSQRAAAQHSAGAARVLAPAGSGKTKTLVARVVELVARGISPAEILLLAFNTKAAEQLEERLAARHIPCTRRIQPGCPPRAVHCATFNAFGARYQREVMRHRVTVDTGGSHSRALMRQAMAEAGCGLDVLKPVRGADPVGSMLAALPRVRAGLAAPEGVWLSVLSRGDPPVVTLPFAAVHERYTRLQELAGRQSFDDQIYFAVVDLLASPTHRRLLQRQYRYILVDEFQDLNAAQLALVDVLSRPHRNLFVVGDDDQLIYGWRYADPDAILGFHGRVPPPPHSTTYALGTNYRCSQAVVAAAARLVQHNRRREPKAMAPRAGAQEGTVQFHAAPSWAERGATMCEFLRGERSRLDCAWSDLAVLSRYRSQQFAVALALDAGGVPRAPSLGARLLTTPRAQILRACLALVCTPLLLSPDEVRRLAAELGPQLSEEAGARPRAAATEEANDAASCGPRLGRPSTPSAANPTPDLTCALLARAAGVRTRLGLLPAPGASSAGPPAAAGACSSAVLVSAVLDGLELARAWHESAPPEATLAATHGDAGSPFRLLDALALLGAAYPEPVEFLATWDRLAAEEHLAHAPGPADAVPAQDRVALATIHAAKGREYASVVIPDYDCDVSGWSPEEIEEERRVLYVGVTRACHSLLLTIDSTRPYVHPFLRELVPPPETGEHSHLSNLLTQQDDSAAAERARQRLAELEALFPDVCRAPDAPGAAAD